MSDKRPDVDDLDDPTFDPTLSGVIDLIEADEDTDPWLRSELRRGAQRRMPPNVGRPPESER